MQRIEFSVQFFNVISFSVLLFALYIAASNINQIIFEKEILNQYDLKERKILYSTKVISNVALLALSLFLTVKIYTAIVKCVYILLNVTYTEQLTALLIPVLMILIGSFWLIFKTLKSTIYELYFCRSFKLWMKKIEKYQKAILNMTKKEVEQC